MGKELPADANSEVVCRIVWIIGPKPGSQRIMNRLVFCCLFVIAATAVPTVVSAQHFFSGCQCSQVDLMDTRNFRLRDYRRMFMNGSTPSNQEMIGTWYGVNKGVVTLAGYKQFIKEIQPTQCGVFGDNIKVHQVPRRRLRCGGWRLKLDSCGAIQRHDRFMVQPQNCIGRFGHGKIFSYRDGGNRRLAPSRLIVDRVVKIDDNHLLGRAVVRTFFGPIPVAYFMLERAN